MRVAALLIGITVLFTTMAYSQPWWSAYLLGILATACVFGAIGLFED